MKKTLLNFFSDKLYVELTITAVLFLIALLLDKLMDFIIYMLYFICLLYTSDVYKRQFFLNFKRNRFSK